QIISHFLLFGSILIMYNFTEILLKKYYSEVWENYKGTAILRGFSLATLWVISIPSFIFAVDTLQSSLFFSVLQGFIIYVFFFFFSVILFYFKNKKQKKITSVLQSEIKKIPNKSSKKYTIEFICVFTFLFGTIILSNILIQVKLLLLMPIIIII